jgi:hypothetical protein
MAATSRLAALLLSVSVLPLSACGQTDKDSASDFKGEQKAVAQTVEDFQKASRKRDQDKICQDILAPDLVSKIKTASKGTCQDALKDALRDVDSFELDVKKVAIDAAGTSAQATVRSDAGKVDKTDTFRLVKLGSTWKISALSAVS